VNSSNSGVQKAAQELEAAATAAANTVVTDLQAKVDAELQRVSTEVDAKTN
jgi:hypothetical protein